MSLTCRTELYNVYDLPHEQITQEFKEDDHKDQTLCAQLRLHQLMTNVEFVVVTYE